MAAYTSIDDPTIYFNTVLYSGTGSENARTGVGFQPDWVWIKQRNGTTNQMLTDSVRGATKTLHAQNNDAESTDAQALKSFDSDGFTVGTDTDVNGAGGTGGTYVAWNWKKTATAGFDIVSYTGNGSNRTISHSLSAVPKVMFVKRRSSSSDWTCFFKVLGNTKRLILNSDAAVETATSWWNSTDPTSSVFSLGTSGGVNDNSETYINYLFAEKQGYSKFGSYTGNGNADGAFVYTGFKPAWVLIKLSSGSGNSWNIFDNKREGYNPDNDALFADVGGAETTTDYLDFVSSGFKIRNNSSAVNTNSSTYVFMAFAESPFVTSSDGGSIPTTAR